MISLRSGDQIDVLAMKESGGLVFEITVSAVFILPYFFFTQTR